MHNSNISLVKRQKAGADIGNIRSTTLNGTPQSSGEAVINLRTHEATVPTAFHLAGGGGESEVLD